MERRLAYYVDSAFYCVCEWRRNWEPDGGVKVSQSVRKVSSREPAGYCRGMALPWAVGEA